MLTRDRVDRNLFDNRIVVCGDFMSENLEVLEARTELRFAMGIISQASALVVSNNDEYAHADKMLGSIKDAAKAAEKKRTDLVNPLNHTVKKINAEFKPVQEAFDRAAALYRAPMSDYQAKIAAIRATEERMARDEELKLRAAAEAAIAKAISDREAAEEEIKRTGEPQTTWGEIAIELAKRKIEKAESSIDSSLDEIRSIKLEAVIPQKVTAVSSKTYEVWKYEIEDESIIPSRYKILDVKTIAADVRVLKGDAKIPGIRVYSVLEVK